MPASVLRHYQQAAVPAATVTTVAPAVAATRALVISKVVVVSRVSTSQTFALSIGQNIAENFVLGPGEVYTESNLVALAGEAVNIYVYGATANAVTVHVFGEEVDNA